MEQRRKLTRRELEAVVERHGSVCWLCEQPVEGEPVSGDHVVPVTFGETNEVANLRPAHDACNRARGEWCVPSFYAWALVRGDDHLVPQRLREELRPGAVELAARARVHYGRALRWTSLEPLTGSWELLPGASARRLWSAVPTTTGAPPVTTATRCPHGRFADRCAPCSRDGELQALVPLGARQAPSGLVHLPTCWHPDETTFASWPPVTDVEFRAAVRDRRTCSDCTP